MLDEQLCVAAKKTLLFSGASGAFGVLGASVGELICDMSVWNNVQLIQLLVAGGVGNALLAYAPDAVREQVLCNLSRFTPYTITQPGRLVAELREVQRLGYAQTHEEMSLGACSVAVPIRSADGRVVAALGIVVPSLRRDRPRLVAALQVAAQGIGRSLSTGRG